MASPIAVAFVEVVPDTKTFAGLLQTQVTAAIRAVKVPPVVVPVTTAGGAAGIAQVQAAAAQAGAAAGAAATSTAGLTKATANQAAAAAAGTREAARLASAQAGVASAELRLATATAALSRLQASDTATTSQLTLAELRQTAAVDALAAANARLAVAGSGAAAKGLLDLGAASNVAKGAAIGLSRITPVTVFGLRAEGVAAIALGLALKGAVSSAAEFEKSLNILQATSGATNAEMEKISAFAKQLGADISLPATSAQDAAVALTELSKAGLSIQDTIGGARGVLELAAAAGLDAATAAGFAATELNAFELAGTQASHVADLLAGASISAQGEITDFALAFQQAGTAAHQVGLSIEQTTALLTELAKAGLTGSDAGTSLRVTLLRLVPTTKQAAEFQELLGVKLDKTKDIGEQLPDIIEQYRHALLLLNPTNRQAALQQIFGQDAFRAASIIFQEGAAGLDELTAATGREGQAAILADARTKGLSGAVQGLSSNFETLGITIGSALKGPLTDAVHDLTTVVSALNTAAEATKVLGEQEGLLGKALHRVGDSFKNSVKDQVPVWGAYRQTKAVVKPLIGLFRDTQVEMKNVEVSSEEMALAVARGNRIIARSVDEARQAVNIGPANVGADIARRGIDEDIQAAAKANADNRTAEQKAADARIDAGNALKKKKKTADELLLQGIAPDPLLQAKLNAEISGSKAATLAADRAIEAYFQDALDKTKGRGPRYTAILKGLAAAHSVVQADIDEIASENERDAKETASAIKDAASAAADLVSQGIADAQDAARLAIEAADLTDDNGADNRTAVGAYIKLLRSQIASGKLNHDELKAAKSELVSVQVSQKQEIEATIQADIDFNREVLDFAIHRAEVTTPSDTSDEEKLIRQAIAQDNKLIKLYKKAGKSKRDLLLSVQKDRFELQQKLKGLTQGSGSFSLNDLWASAAKQLADFGSNISFNPTTPGGNVQSVASNILDQKPDKLTGVIAAKADKQISEAETTNGLLRDIRDTLRVPGVQGGTPWRRRDPLTDTPGTAADAAKFAVAGVGGM